MIMVNEPLLSGNEKKYINECIDTGWISSEGPFVKLFEEQMANFVGRNYATACTSGTAAIDIAVSALELQEGDEVIIPSFTIISCAQALTKLGVKPVLVDCEYDTFNMKIEDIETKINSNTRAIMMVHMYGLTVDVDKILDLAKKYNLKIIEDAAHAIGLTYKGLQCGSFGDISIFSFYPNKHITTGEGGMVLCNDANLDKRSKSLRNLFFSDQRFIHNEIGFNYRMTNLQAALGVAQLENIEQIVKKKRWIGETYNNLLEDLVMINLPIKYTKYCENIYWVYAITLKEKCSKTAVKVMSELRDLNIGTRPFYYPMHKQPVFNKSGLFLMDKLPNSEKLYETGFYIPSGLALTKDQAEEVSRGLHTVLS